MYWIESERIFSGLLLN